MRQLVAITPHGNQVSVLDFVLDPDTGTTYAICLTQAGSLTQFRLTALRNVHYESY